MAVVPLGVFYLAALQYHWLTSLDQAIGDVGVASGSCSDQSAQVVLVAIDNRSLTTCFSDPPFPISRHLRQHTSLIEKLDSAGAALVVLDILFDRLPSGDSTFMRAFATAVARCGRVVLAGAVEQDTTLSVTGVKQVSVERLCLPPPPIVDAALALGLVNTPVDPDGAVRRFTLNRSFLGRRFPSLAYAVMQRMSPRDTVLHDRGDTVLIDYACAPDKIIRIPFCEILAGGSWQPLVRNKIVVVGVTETASMDRFKNPAAIVTGQSNVRVSGTEVQCLAIGTLLEGQRIHAAGFGLLTLIGLCLISAWIYSFHRLRPVPSLLISLGLILLLCVLSLTALIWSGFFFPPGALVLTLIVGAPPLLGFGFIILRWERDEQEAAFADVRVDLMSAQEIQKKLQPAQFVDNELCEISALQITHHDVGGDYYDVVRLSAEKIGFLIGDVAGKGIGGSLIMSNLQGRFRRVAREMAAPSQVLVELNELVGQASGLHHLFVTLFYGILDCRTRVLTYGNAGHCSPIICSRLGEARLLTEGGVPLGPFQEADWSDYACQLDQGDVICLYTDGVTEAGGSVPQIQFSEAGIMKCLREKHDEKTEYIRDHVLEACRKFNRGETFDDDWTLLVIKVR